jgi:hypothetical protein
MNLIARGPVRDTTFQVSEQSGVWAVSKNGAFYGDYLSREQAVRSACYGARSVEATGGQARVFGPPGNALISHRDLAIAP